ncbi:DUF481 domain-containing protein [Myxococcota bacterium]|nr:DUF481 domain-containing protein [Myxococcota bacterium]
MSDRRGLQWVWGPLVTLCLCGAVGAADVVPLKAPPASDPKGYEWIRMTSGEWLKGSVERMRDESISFHSDELGDLTLDWDDVSALYSPHVNMYFFEDRELDIGTAVIRDGEVIVTTKDGTKTRKRKDLVSIIPGRPREINYWSGKLTANLSVQRGNTDHVEYGAIATIRRETPDTRLRVDYNGSYGEVGGVKNTNNHHAEAHFDIFVTRRFYVTPAALGVFQDEFQNIELRLTPGAGMGYEVVDHKKVEWTVEVGGEYLQTEYLSVAPGQPIVDKGGAVRLRSTLALEPHSSTDLTFTYSTNLAIGNGTNSQHGLAVLSFEITDLLSINLSFTWDRVDDPTPTSTGVVPQKDDYRLAAGIGFTL